MGRLQTFRQRPIADIRAGAQITPMPISTEPPQAAEQVIEQRLIECGLSRSGFTVKYEDKLRSIEIVITPAAGAREEHFSCIRRAVDHEIVTFDDRAMQEAYSDYVSELLRPEMLASATAELKKRGLLKGFPERDKFPSLEAYAQALERHGGVPPKSVLRVEGDTIVFDPPRGQTDFRDFEKKYSNLIAVIMFAAARGDFKDFGFIGNERLAEPKGG
jgi:hypothetical protein